MASDVRYELTGVDNVVKNCKLLGKAVTERLSKRALKKAMDPVVVAMKQNAPVGKDALAGLLRDSIGTKTSNKKGTQRIVAGPMRGRKVRVGTVTRGKNKGKVLFKNPSRYAHLQEFGSVHQAAKPFARPAWQSAGGEKALQTYQVSLATDLEKEVRKLKTK